MRENNLYIIPICAIGQVDGIIVIDGARSILVESFLKKVRRIIRILPD
jgi:hypothetical protein